MKQKTFLYLFLFSILIISCTSDTRNSKINRFELVNRHNINHSEINPLNSLSVGNGEFTFTVDITGLQTFPDYYEKGVPLGTQSQWGWHSFPNPENYSLSDTYKKYKVGNDSIRYVYQYMKSPNDRKNKASQWLRENQHRLHLGLIGLEILKNDSTTFSINDIKGQVQQLNLWKGEIKSQFKIEGTPVSVITYCHQGLDMISVRITSDLLTQGKLKIKIQFPYATHEKFSPSYDLSNPEKHTTQIIENTDNGVIFSRKLDNDAYYSQMDWKDKAELKKVDNHVYSIIPSKEQNSFELNCFFSKDLNNDYLQGFAETKKNNEEQWERFWKSGGAVDFSECKDPRAFELERRVVLSQYLTKIQCSGSFPPQETGLTYNSWHGKFHMEMHWWHGIHFIRWNRAELIEKQLNYYFDIFDMAKHTAEMQGYKGVRWPKMVDPTGRESPSTIGTFLIWQQPHIIYFSELLFHYYRKDKAVLERYKKLVFATADFMASYARMDSASHKYVLGPALIPAQECFNPETTVNPAFELAYWHWGLQVAQTWRKRLGLAGDNIWQHVLDNLADLPVKDGLYLFAENATDSYSNSRHLTDHPIVLGILGFLPKTEKVNEKILQNTLIEIQKKWNWESIWGWDIPLIAMNATSLNKPELAVDFLLMNTQKNTYLMNGHNYQDDRLTIYLPGNGGLLTAVAMMCTYRNDKGRNGFPDNGNWNVKYENLLQYDVR